MGEPEKGGLGYRLIGISGKAGAGKSTVASAICGSPLFGWWGRLSFAGVLKREVSASYGFPLEWCYTEEGKTRVVGSCGLTVRKLLQEYGAEMRGINPRHWVDKIQRQLKELDRMRPWGDDPAPVVVIDDVRYPNEAELILGLGGSLYRIDTYTEWKPGPGADHLSEIALDEWSRFTNRFNPPYGAWHLWSIARSIVLTGKKQG